MKKIISLLLFTLPILCQGQVYLDEMRNLLSTHQYNEALNYGATKIKTLKAKNQIDQELNILTFISMCLNDELKIKGCQSTKAYFENQKNTLQSINNYYDYLQCFKKICETGQFSSLPTAYTNSTKTFIHVNTKSKAALRANFKGYHYLQMHSNYNSILNKLTDEALEKASENYGKPASVQVVSIGTKHDKLRALPKETSKASLTEYIKKTYNTSSFLSSANFVVISPGKNSIEISKTLNLLEKTLSYYKNSLSLKGDKNLIIIYLSKSYPSMSSDLMKYGGYEDYNNSIIGYSDIQTNSVIAWIPASEKIGTLKHELIHILLKNLIYCPEWYQEALASLYEESKFTSQNQLLPLDNWRLYYLKAMTDEQRSDLIDAYIFSDETAENRLRDNIMKDIDAAAERYKKQSSWTIPGISDQFYAVKSSVSYNFINFCNFAIGRYFVLYLNSKQSLNNINKNIFIQEQNLFAGQDYQSFDSVIIKETKFNSKTLLKKNFIGWLSRQRGMF